jgi:hypothetical protein
LELLVRYLFFSNPSFLHTSHEVHGVGDGRGQANSSTRVVRRNFVTGKQIIIKMCKKIIVDKMPLKMNLLGFNLCENLLVLFFFYLLVFNFLNLFGFNFFLNLLGFNFQILKLLKIFAFLDNNV